MAIITDSQGRLLITQRSPKATHAGFWEFPGGKLEANETAEAALIREIKEEVGLDILQCVFAGQIDHQYDTKLVSLFVYRVIHFQGEAICQEEQTDLRWVSHTDLHQFTFPAANEKIIKLIL